MNEDLPILYIKPGCPGCDSAGEFLGNHGVSYREVDVTSDREAFAHMSERSGQTNTPTLEWRGQLLADFDSDQLCDFLHEQGVEFEDS